MYWKNLSKALVRTGATLLINLDRMLNAAVGGDYRATISGRIGYFALKKDTRYWNTLAAIVDFTFRPYEGRGHCENTRIWELRHVPRDAYRRSSDPALVGMALLVTLGCPLLYPFVWLARLSK